MKKEKEKYGEVGKEGGGGCRGRGRRRGMRGSKGKRKRRGEGGKNGDMDNVDKEYILEKYYLLYDNSILRKKQKSSKLDFCGIFTAKDLFFNLFTIKIIGDCWKKSNIVKETGAVFEIET